MAKASQDPIFTISLEKGMADRHRMPVGQVIQFLNEVRQMLIDAGRELQRERGDDPRNLDFGLELVADDAGSAFTKGSLRAKIAITANIELGIEAAERVLDTVRDLSVPVRRKPVRRVAVVRDAVEAKIVNRLDRITFIHDRSKTQARFNVTVPRGIQKERDKPKAKPVVFGAPAVRALAGLREPVFSEENVTLYGKLTQLKDRSQMDEVSGKFWGELRRDNGERWRIQFSDNDQPTIVPLFRQQVCVQGSAHYFQTRNPKLICETAEVDGPRDYVAAFDEILGINKQVYNADLKTLLERRYEG